jgi:hypothetical protein
MNHPNLKYIGHVAVFYLPSKKLDDPRFGALYQTPRTLLHHFIIDNYDAYTHQKSDIQGHWREHAAGQIFHDVNEMFEVSFAGEQRIVTFVDFLAAICYLMEEECVYLRMGEKSYLIQPTPRVSNAIRKLLNVSYCSPTNTPDPPPTS